MKFYSAGMGTYFVSIRFLLDFVEISSGTKCILIARVCASFYISHTHSMTACKSCCLTLTTSLWSMVSSTEIETSDVEAGSMTNVVVADPAAESTRSLKLNL